MTETNDMPQTESPNYVLDDFFRWSREETETASLPGGHVMNFAEETADLMGGINTILNLLAENELHQDANGEGKKLFNDFVSSKLLRMAIRSSSILEERSHRLMDWAYEYHTPEGRSAKDCPSFADMRGAI